MPIQYKTYGCKFKCGHKRSKNFKKMLEHEERCWHNPLNKTCITCKFGELVNDSCEHPETAGTPVERWRYRDCHEPHCQEVEFEENSFKEKILPIEHCEYWKEK